jgi:sulfoxide reductase heme-binding subunit YedZ
MLRRRWIKIPVFLLCLAPFLRLAWLFWQQDLGPNPLETITHFTGDWAIRLVVATLAVTPLRKLLHLPDLVRFRRMIGLFAFFYGCLHLMIYLYFDRLLEFSSIAHDVAKRPFITMGMTAFLLMLPLAATSTTGWIRRLGGKRWQALHRLVYGSAIAAVIHYYWLVKSDVRLPLMYGAIVAVLLLYRVAVWLRTGRTSRKAVRPTVVTPA